MIEIDLLENLSMKCLSVVSFPLPAILHVWLWTTRKKIFSLIWASTFSM